MVFVSYNALMIGKCIVYSLPKYVNNHIALLQNWMSAMILARQFLIDLFSYFLSFFMFFFRISIQLLLVRVKCVRMYDTDNHTA